VNIEEHWARIVSLGESSFREHQVCHLQALSMWR